MILRSIYLCGSIKIINRKMMTKDMKTIIIALSILLFNILSCSSDVNEFKDDGTITGYDVRECACCGGYFIDIRKVTYRFFELPVNTNFNLDSASFPVYVRLDWTKNVNSCLGDEITILRIEKK